MRYSLPVECEVADAPAVHVVEHPQPAAASLARVRAEDRGHEVRRVHRHLPRTNHSSASSPPITAHLGPAGDVEVVTLGGEVGVVEGRARALLAGGAVTWQSSS